MQKKKTTGSCESCAYYAYDEDYECYTCDDGSGRGRAGALPFRRLLQTCPITRTATSTRVVRKQL